MGKKKGQKSGQKKKHSKSKNNNKKNNKKTTLPLGGNDLSAKLYSHMEKHKEVGRCNSMNVILLKKLYNILMCE